MASHDPLPLPLELAGLTREWLETALRQSRPDLHLRAAGIVDVNHGTCTKVRIALEHDAPDIPARVILKGGFEPHSRLMHTMHAQEVHAYADVAPHSPLRMPASWFAQYNAGAQQGIVIMDDLVARGVAFCHPQRPQSPREVARRLTMLARHHAMTWHAAASFPWATNVFDATYFDTVLLPEVWQGYVASARGAAASVCFHDLGWMKEALARMGRFARRLPSPLIHGDTHLGNLYIDTDGEPGFFDSLPHLAPAMYEISYHVTCALDVPVRRAHERALVAHYRDELLRCGVAAPSLDAFMHQFGVFLANGYAIFLVNASEFQPEAINTAYTARFSAAMLDHDTMGLIAGLD